MTKIVNTYSVEQFSDALDHGGMSPDFDWVLDYAENLQGVVTAIASGVWPEDRVPGWIVQAFQGVKVEIALIQKGRHQTFGCVYSLPEHSGMEIEAVTKWFCGFLDKPYTPVLQ